MSYFNQINTIVKNNSKITYYHALFLLAISLISIGGMIFDDRTLMGVSVWLKPFKFGISGAIFVYSIGYFSHLYNYGKRKKNFVNHLIAWSTSIDIVIILIQAARGVKSHYNMSSAFDGILFAMMGFLISLSVLVMVIFMIDTVRRKPKVSFAILSALFMGWIAMLYGSYVGGQMIGQMAHNVGVADGGAGMPLVNWSLSGGDLRIAHFFGIHAIQIIPIAGFLFTKKWSNAPLKAVIATGLFGFLYIGLIAFTFYQAANGIPLIASVLN